MRSVHQKEYEKHASPLVLLPDSKVQADLIQRPLLGQPDLVPAHRRLHSRDSTAKVASVDIERVQKECSKQSWYAYGQNVRQRTLFVPAVVGL